MIEECAGKKAVIKQLPDQPGDVPVTYADCTKAGELLGYSPKFDIRQGMKVFAMWYQQFYSQRQFTVSPPTSDYEISESED